MKFFSTLFFLMGFLSLAYTAAISSFNEDVEMIKRAVKNTHFIPSVLPDGRKRIAVYDGDILQGSIVETVNGDVVAYDAYGKELNLDDTDLDDEVEDAETGKMVKRASKFTILRVLWAFIKKFGARAWRFIYCLGFEVSYKCAPKILHCAQAGLDFGECISGVICGGKALRSCARVF